MCRFIYIIKADDGNILRNPISKKLECSCKLQCGPVISANIDFWNFTEFFYFFGKISRIQKQLICFTQKAAFRKQGKMMIPQCFTYSVIALLKTASDIFGGEISVL